MTAVTRSLVKKHGQTILTDAQRYYDQGMISDRTYQLIVTIDKSMDQDNGA